MRTPLVLFGLLMSITLTAQNEIISGGNYYFENYTAQPQSSDKRFAAGSETAVNYARLNEMKKYRLTVQSVQNGTVIFKYWPFKDSDTDKAINGEDGDLLYTMNEADFKARMGVLYDRYEIRAGFYAVPYKLRFNDFDFESDVTVGGNVSTYIRINREKEHGFAVEPLIGIGLTKINTDESNSSTEEPGSLSAFTLNTGVLIHLTEKINLGFFYGWDILSDKDYQNSGWEYHGNGWLGLGLNISFSETRNNTQKDKGQKNP